MRSARAWCIASVVLASCSSPPPSETGDADPASEPDAAPATDSGLVAQLEEEALEDNWALRVTRMIDAWHLVRARGRQPGEGIRIGHPDTGISLHPELGASALLGVPSPLDLANAYDVVDRDHDAAHDFGALNRIPPSHGHGTETASVIVSPLGCPDAATPRPCVTGGAPAATLIPLRASNSVVLVTGDALADAVDAAVARDVHVISISMGGVGDMPRLRAAIERALAAGIIVVAAAGNGTGPIVTSPGTIDGVVCIAGVTPELKPWSVSASGDRVDLAGPAVDVRFARTRQQKGTLVYDVGDARGTSDATALTTAAAAIWLTYHGRDALLARYGAAGVPRVFRALLRDHGYTTPAGWPAAGWGRGVLDVVRLLEAPLPAVAP